MEIAINKVLITEEARFDFESMLDRPIPKPEIKRETECYIDNLIEARRFSGRYLRAKWLDEETGQMLMLFLYRGSRFGLMQVWELKGICAAEDWTEELEESGQIRAWLNSPLDPKEDRDWVWDMRVREEQEKREWEDYNDD